MTADAMPRPEISTAPLGTDHPGPGVMETHCAWVFLLGDLAVKVKKPFDLGFVDWRDPAARRRACEREMVLNRSSPRMFTRGGLAQDGGKDCEALVVMRRMPDSRRLSTLLSQGFDVAPACGWWHGSWPSITPPRVAPGG